MGQIPTQMGKRALILHTCGFQVETGQDTSQRAATMSSSGGAGSCEKQDKIRTNAELGCLLGRNLRVQGRYQVYGSAFRVWASECNPARKAPRLKSNNQRQSQVSTA